MRKELLSFVGMLALSNAAFADVELTLSRTKYDEPPSGLWWSNKESHQEEMRTTYVRLALTKELGPHSAISFGIYDAGKYEQHAWARPDAGPSAGGAPDLYNTKGRITGVSLLGELHTAGNRLGVYGEAGFTYYRETFNLERSDGFNFQYRAFGPGYMLGAGVRFGDKFKLGCGLLNGNVGAKMNGGGFPSGKGLVYLPLTGSYKF